MRSAVAKEGGGWGARAATANVTEYSNHAHNACNYGKWFPFSAKRGREGGRERRQFAAKASTQALGWF